MPTLSARRLDLLIAVAEQTIVTKELSAEDFRELLDTIRVMYERVQAGL